MALVIRRADEISVDVVPVEMLSLISAEQWHDICSVVKVPSHLFAHVYLAPS
jgi:hypothetical protein